MSEQPYYFQIVPRTILSKFSEKDTCQFRFHIHKANKWIESSKEEFSGKFQDNKMKVQNAKINFFLPNYYAGKNAGAKFTFQLSKKAKYYEQKMVGSYVIDANVYVEEFKRTDNNHFAELWDLGQFHRLQVEIFLDESRYLLEKVLRQSKSYPATSFDRPLQSSSLGLSKNSQLEDQQYDNEDRFKQKRLALLNQYSGAIVGLGGYRRIFDLQQQEQVQRKKQKEQQQARRQLQDKKYELKRTQDKRQVPNSKGMKESKEKAQIKRTQSFLIEQSPDLNSIQKEIKSQKYVIIIIVLLIILGCGYFMTKLYFRDSSLEKSLQQDGIISKPKKVKNQQNKKGGKSIKNSKKSKTTSQL